jgi:two-component system phosphate regulon sensor histidine kinase PhoR
MNHHSSTRHRQEKLPSASVILQRLHEERQRSAAANTIHDALISSIGEGVIIVDEYGHVMEANQNALDTLGYLRDEMVGAWLGKILPSKDKEGRDIPTSERPVFRSLLTGQPTTQIISYVKKDGSLLPVSSTAAPFMVKGMPRGAIIIFRDFSHEIQVERAKDEFVSLASHQLRTPLTAMMLYAQMLEECRNGDLNDEQSLYLAKIKTSTERLQSLVTDFLNISKLELGRLDIQLKETDLEELIKIELSEIQPTLKAKSAGLTFNSPAKKIPKAIVDPMLLGQAVHNLLTNAIRYTPSDNGQVEVSLGYKDNAFTICVIDNGIGIPEESKPRIFQRLYRAENAIETQEGGTGLGLYFVKKVAEAFGGGVWFESQLNKGSTFCISLPHGSLTA